MTEFIQNTVTKRFISIYEEIKKRHGITSDAEFGQNVDYSRQSLNEILKGRRDVTIEFVRKLVTVFNVNPLYLYNDAVDTPFIGVKEGYSMVVNEGEQTYNLVKVQKEPKDKNAQDIAQYHAQDAVKMIVLTVDAMGNSLIPFVHVKSQAGYMRGYGDPEYIKELPHYSLPGLNNGRFMAFQIDGWSMFKEDIGEGLRPDDWIICQSVESLEDIRDTRVYTIVTKEDGIVTKRLLKRLKNSDEPRIICMSDNKSGNYEHFTLKPEQIAQVWEFKMHFNRFLPNPSDLFDKFSEIQGDYILLKEKLKAIEARLGKL